MLKKGILLLAPNGPQESLKNALGVSVGPSVAEQEQSLHFELQDMQFRCTQVVTVEKISKSSSTISVFINLPIHVFFPEISVQRYASSKSKV